MKSKYILYNQVIAASDVSVSIWLQSNKPILLVLFLEIACILFAVETTVIKGELIYTFKTTTKKLQVAVLNRVKNH